MSSEKRNEMTSECCRPSGPSVLTSVDYLVLSIHMTSSTINS